MKNKPNVDLLCDVAELISFVDVEDGNVEILQNVVATVAGHMHADVCSVYIYDEEEEILTLRATQGLSKEAIGKVTLKLGEGLTGQVVQTKTPLRVPSALKSDDNKFFPGISEEKFDAFLAVPILRGGRRIGALVAQSRQEDFFDDNDVKALRAIAAQLATMIENIKLLDEVREEVRGKKHHLSPAAPTGERKKLLRGRSASGGIARGTAMVFGEDRNDLLHFADTSEEQHTLEDFRTALRNTKRQITRLQRQTSEELADVAVLIFSAHLLILEDDEFIGQMVKLIEAGVAPLKAIATVVDQYVRIFSASKMPLIQEKAIDVKDLGIRLGRNLLNQTDETDDYRGRIVVAHELLPSDILKFSAENIEGIAISSGVSSHNAIICRSLGIPMVSLRREDADGIHESDLLLMDADQGIIYLQPDEDICEKYQKLEETWQAVREVAERKDKTLTKDGEQVHIYANINLLSDLKPAREIGAEGVGLYRSEFPFIVRNDFPSEEEQYLIYKKIVEQMDDLPVTFRTLDIGGDKMLSYYSNVNEANPFLGMRAIRFSLENKSIFVQQLRAFLRAGANGNIRIMFPLVASLDDFEEARALVHECMKELDAEGIPFCRDAKLGVMVELPSAVEVAEELAREADFLSIGSNDLVQYMLAVDRTNEAVSKLYLPYHPAVLRAINRIVHAAGAEGKDVSICGDLSADPRMLPFLLGVGLRKISIDVQNAPTVRKLVEETTLEEAQNIAREMLGFARVRCVENFLKKRGL